MYRYPFSPDQLIQEADWEVYLRETAQSIVEVQSPKRYSNAIKITYYMAVAASGVNTEISQFDWFKSGRIFPVLPA